MNIIFVSQFTPDPHRGGGEHRAYQIVHDLIASVGRSNVYPVHCQSISALPDRCKGGGRRSNSILRGSRRILSSARRVFRSVYAGHVGWFERKRFLSSVLRNRSGQPVYHSHRRFRQYATSQFLDRYQEIVRDIPRPAVCVIEHISLAQLISLNRSFQIPTVACLANLETLDHGAPDVALDLGFPLAWTMLGLTNELRALAACDARLFISKTEAGLASGLGLTSLFYPYRPVGAIRRHLMEIRRCREASRQSSRLLLMVGSAIHATTRFGTRQFLADVIGSGLPEGSRIVVAGRGTRELAAELPSHPSVELAGWIEPERLTQLMIESSALLVPQTLGFGAVTRLPEFCCAGIPVITTPHPLYAMDPLPGVIVAETRSEWQEAMAQVVRQETGARPSLKEYEGWEATQDNPLSRLVWSALGRAVI